jgi:hypothetical protein
MNRAFKFRKSLMSGILIILILSFLAVLAVRVIGGRSLGIKSLVQSVISLGRAVTNSQHVRSSSHGEFTNIIFLHHSVGANLIEQSDIRERLSRAGFNLWDHDYNGYGLRDPAGKPMGYNYNVPNDNTDPDGLAAIFAQPVYGLPVNTMSGLAQHEVIAFKSCFPANDITTDEKLEQYKTYYLSIRNVMDKHPDKVFIVITPPPLNPAETQPTIAARARAFANWLKSDEYHQGHPNVFTFDLYGNLAGDDPASPDYNMLRKAYQDGTDSHPNRAANETIGPLLADYISQSVARYRAVYARTRGQS